MNNVVNINLQVNLNDLDFVVHLLRGLRKKALVVDFKVKKNGQKEVVIPEPADETPAAIKMPVKTEAEIIRLLEEAEHEEAIPYEAFKLEFGL